MKQSDETDWFYRIRSLTWSDFLAVGTLFFIFLWFYGRFAPQLYFVMDDYIETRYNLSKPLWTVIVDSFSGELNWSGYRPLTYALRAVFSHWLRLDYVIGYYLFGFALHFVNTCFILPNGCWPRRLGPFWRRSSSYCSLPTMKRFST